MEELMCNVSSLLRVIKTISDCCCFLETSGHCCSLQTDSGAHHLLLLTRSLSSKVVIPITRETEGVGRVAGEVLVLLLGREVAGGRGHSQVRPLLEPGGLQAREGSQHKLTITEIRMVVVRHQVKCHGIGSVIENHFIQNYDCSDGDQKNS